MSLFRVRPFGALPLGALFRYRGVEYVKSSERGGMISGFVCEDDEALHGPEAKIPADAQCREITAPMRRTVSRVMDKN